MQKTPKKHSATRTIVAKHSSIPQRRSAFARLVVDLGVFYCFGFVALALLATFLPERPWWLAIANDVLLPLLFAPILLLFGAAWCWQSRLLGCAAGIAAVTFGVLFQHALLPPPAVNTAVGMPLRVATYNHLYTNAQPSAVLDAIKTQQADIVAIQELSTPVARALREGLSDMYPYQWHDPAENTSGLGLLSRFPIDTGRIESSYRGQVATVRIGAIPVKIINVHPNTPFVYSGRGGLRGILDFLPTYGTSKREQQITALLSAIDQTAGPLIVLGDFNTSERDPLYSAFAAHLRDSYRETTWGFGATFPNQATLGPLPIPPFVRIDYVWTRGGIEPISARVECASGGSDHCMLVADLILPMADLTTEKQLSRIHGNY